MAKKARRINLNELTATQADFAALVGCSPALVSSLVKDGTLRRGGTLGEWTRAFINREVELTDGADGTTEWQAERTHLMRLRRQVAELDYARASGALCDLAEVERFVADLCTTARVSFMALPNVITARAAPMVRDAASQIALHRLIDDEIRRVLTEMAERGDELRDEVGAPKGGARKVLSDP